MLLVIDNYDSFVHNLARYFEQLGQETVVVRNDAIRADEVRRLRPAAVVFSPGPCVPQQAGNAIGLVRDLADEVPMLGVCLGHQIIAQAFSAGVVRAPRPVHGQTSAIAHGQEGLFAELPTPLSVCRYHSLVVDPTSLPPQLRPTAWTDDRLLMAFQHVSLPLLGVQFHPEAILTEFGYALLSNFLRIAGVSSAAGQPIRAAQADTNGGILDTRWS